MTKQQIQTVDDNEVREDTYEMDGRLLFIKLTNLKLGRDRHWLCITPQRQSGLQEFYKARMDIYSNKLTRSFEQANTEGNIEWFKDNWELHGKLIGACHFCQYLY